MRKTLRVCKSHQDSKSVNESKFRNDVIQSPSLYKLRYSIYVFPEDDDRGHFPVNTNNICKPTSGERG